MSQFEYPPGVERPEADERELIERRETHRPHLADWREQRYWWYGDCVNRLEYIGSQKGWYKAPSLLDEVEQGEVVYVLHAAEVGRVKIGRTGDVKKRLTQLRVGSPVLLRLVTTYPIESGVSEGYLHKRFALHRLHGEWFDDAILDELP